MAKTLDVIGSSVLPKIEKSSPVLPSIVSLARRAATLLKTQKDRDIERFIRERGGVMSDDIERVLSQTLTRT